MESLGAMRIACLVAALGLVTVMNLEVQVGQVAARHLRGGGLKNCTTYGMCKFTDCCCRLLDGIPKCFKDGKPSCNAKWSSKKEEKPIPFCASDGKTYTSKAELARTSCEKNVFLMIKHDDFCNKTQAKDSDDMDSEFESY